MSLKKKVGAIAAALTTVCGMSAAAAIPASAATPACGQYCIGVFSSELGTFAEPNFVEHVFGGVATDRHGDGPDRGEQHRFLRGFREPASGSRIRLLQPWTGLGRRGPPLQRPVSRPARVRPARSAHRAMCRRPDLSLLGRGAQPAALHGPWSHRLDHRESHVGRVLSHHQRGNDGLRSSVRDDLSTSRGHRHDASRRSGCSICISVAPPTRYPTRSSGV